MPKERGLAKKRGVVFLMGGTPMHAIDINFPFHSYPLQNWLRTERFVTKSWNIRMKEWKMESLKMFNSW